MIKIGDICPLFFSPLKNKFQQDIDYIQRFHANDNILVQVFSNDSSHSVTAYLRNLVSGNQIPVSFSEYQVNDTIKMYYSAITGLYNPQNEMFATFQTKRYFIQNETSSKK